MPEQSDPASVVQRQLDAYNARDINALLAAYGENAQLFEHPTTLVASGTEALRERFVLRFKEPNLHANLLSRMVMGDLVIDYEEVTRTFAEGPGTLKLIMIYEVKGGRIARAWSIAGPKNMNPP